MTKMAPLEYGYYHIYNRGINSCNLFEDKTNYDHFLRLYEKYIDPIADTFAWCLMPNHFHFLIRIKEENEILQTLQHLSGFKNLTGVKPLHQYFSNLFNAYTKAFNKKYNRHGSLFERPFCRKLITNESYLKHLVYYIHYNPVHHGFVSDIIEYPWSSYSTILSSNKTKLIRKEVIEWFEDLSNFKFHHKQQHEMNQMNDILIDYY